jgi:O-methyltransferase involved in polyketide biosynthesis
MNFAGDTPASVLAYQQLDLDYAKKQAGKLIGTAKKEANDAIEFIEEFEKLYPKTNGKLPAVAYVDEQFEEYVKASQIVSLASGHDPKVGRIIPVIFQAPSKNNMITVDGKEIAAFDNLTGASITWGGQ